MTAPRRTRNANRLEVGRDIRTMIRSLAARRDWKMSRTLEYIGEYVGFGVDAIHNWMNATNLPDCETLERLAQLGVAEAAMDRQWVDRLLLHGACPNRITIVEALFPTASQRVKHNLPHQD